MRPLPLILCLFIFAPGAFAESIESTLIDSIVEKGKPTDLSYKAFSRSDLFYQGSRIFGCEGLADYCESMSHLICKKLGFKKAVEFSWSVPEKASSDLACLT